MQQGNFIDVFLARDVFGYIRPSSEALGVELQRMVFCTEFLDIDVHHPQRTHELRSGSQDQHPSKNSVQKTICCNSTSNAPDDGRLYPKKRRAKNKSIKLPCCIKLAFHFISRGRCTVKQPSSYGCKLWA